MEGISDKDLGTWQVLWDLGHLFPSPDHPSVGLHMEECVSGAKAFASRYRGRIPDLSAEGLLEAVRALENLGEALGRITSYAQLHFSTRVTDPAAGAFLQQVKEFASQVAKELVFFDIEWTHVPDDRAGILLADPAIAHYRHYLESLRRYRPHLLSETEERLLAEISPVGVSSWIGLFEKVLAARQFGETGRTQEEVLADLYAPEREVRKRAADELTDGLGKDLPVLTHVLNTILADKMIDDRLRSYPAWISSMNLANELSDRTVECLISSVTRRYGMVARYYGLKRRILGLDVLYDFDRYAPLPHAPQKSVSWDECRGIVLSSFARFSREMAGMAGRFFGERWIHAPVMSGKAPGAFAHPTVPEVHPYILVNYTGNLRDVETVAHELGHGVHQVLASRRGHLNSQTPLTLAETASVFGEFLVFKDLMARLNSPAERLSFLCAKIESVFATVFRQIAMSRFEDAIHNRRRSAGELSPADFSSLWLSTQREMFGDSLTLTDNYGVWWSYIGHFVHAPGYVYAYAFGELLVLSLYGLFEQGKSDFTRLYLDLLAAGGSDTPYALLAPFGLDLDAPDFWDKGLDVVEGMVGEAERLAGTIGMG